MTHSEDTRDRPGSIFVSYSHQDTELVKPVVGLLRATKDFVFHDVDSIRPGRKWRPQIEEALYAAQLFVLFWCFHSSRSTEVKHEYERALAQDKDVLPVLFDETPLPDQLRAFQWVDFRALIPISHGLLAGDPIDQYVRLASRYKMSAPKWKSLGPRGSVALLVFVCMFATVLWYLSPGSLGTDIVFDVAIVFFVFLVIMVFVTAGLARRASRRIRMENDLASMHTRMHRHMADTLQAEFVRRGLGRE